MNDDQYAPTVINVDGEVGTPSAEIERCACGVLFRRGDWHRCENTGERVEWEAYTDE